MESPLNVPHNILPDKIHQCRGYIYGIRSLTCSWNSRGAKHKSKQPWVGAGLPGPARGGRPCGSRARACCPLLQVSKPLVTELWTLRETGHERELPPERGPTRACQQFSGDKLHGSWNVVKLLEMPLSPLWDSTSTNCCTNFSKLAKLRNTENTTLLENYVLVIKWNQTSCFLRCSL